MTRPPMPDPARPVHCWEDGPRTEDDRGQTCMLWEGHDGPHEWTRDDAIVVDFAPGEPDPVESPPRAMMAPETNPLPACLSHLARRDAQVRARALEEAAAIFDGQNAMISPVIVALRVRAMIAREA